MAQEEPVSAQEPEAPMPEAQAPAAEAPPPAAPAAGAGALQDALDRGMSAYWRRNFAAAAEEFQMAVDADPQSAAANFYLGYSIYKQYEFRPFHPDKQRAKELFARAFELDPSFHPDFKRSSQR